MIHNITTIVLTILTLLICWLFFLEFFEYPIKRGILRIRYYNNMLKYPQKHFITDNRNCVIRYRCSEGHTLLLSIKDMGSINTIPFCPICNKAGDYRFLDKKERGTLKPSDINGYFYRPSLLYFIFHPYLRDCLLRGVLLLKINNL